MRFLFLEAKVLSKIFQETTLILEHTTVLHPKKFHKSLLQKRWQQKLKKKTTKNALNFNEKREFGALEGDIERLQKKKLAIETAFLNVEIAPEDIAKKSKELQETIESMEQKEERWLELTMKLED